MRAAAAALALLAAACGDDDVATVPQGDYAGDSVFVRVHGSGAELAFNCAHGEITSPLRLDAEGRFELPGYFVIDVGPTPIDPVRPPATYRGRYDGHGLTFSLSTQATEAGPF